MIWEHHSFHRHCQQTITTISIELNQTINFFPYRMNPSYTGLTNFPIRIRFMASTVNWMTSWSWCLLLILSSCVSDSLPMCALIFNILVSFEWLNLITRDILQYDLFSWFFSTSMSVSSYGYTLLIGGNRLAHFPPRSLTRLWVCPDLSIVYMSFVPSWL